jgi:hypothetical protein
MKSFEQDPHVLVIVSFIKTQALRTLGSRRRTFDRNTLEGRSGDLEIVLVRTVHYAP